MEVVEVTDFGQEKQFLKLPLSLYAGDPNWVCPPFADIASRFDPAKNPALEKGAACRWILREGENVLGRIAAFHYGAEDREAGMGFFECIDNEQAAAMLFDTAAEWLRRQGHHRCEAPVNFGQRESYWGLLVDGFERPSFQDNYQLPYYKKLFEAYGFEVAVRQTTAKMTFASFRAERLSKLAERVNRNGEYRFTGFDRSRPDKMAEDIVRIYNEAWPVHEHFEPVEQEEIKGMIEEMKPLLLDDLVILAYCGERPIGFFISLRDINPQIRDFRGRFGWREKLLLFLRLRFRKPERLRSIVFGVVPDFQNKGIETGMIWKFYQSIRNHPSIREVELSWVGDFNPRMLSLLEGIGAQPWKTHITYRLKISDSAGS